MPDTAASQKFFGALSFEPSPAPCGSRPCGTHRVLRQAVPSRVVGIQFADLRPSPSPAPNRRRTQSANPWNATVSTVHGVELNGTLRRMPKGPNFSRKKSSLSQGVVSQGLQRRCFDRRAAAAAAPGQRIRLRLNPSAVLLAYSQRSMAQHRPGRAPVYGPLQGGSRWHALPESRARSSRSCAALPRMGSTGRARGRSASLMLRGKNAMRVRDGGNDTRHKIVLQFKDGSGLKARS